MISVLPCFDKQIINELFKKYNLEINAHSGCVIASSTDEVLGYCLYDLTQKGITVRELEPKSDLSLADGILRSALHVAAQRSAMDARYSDTAPEDVLGKLGFIVNPEEKMLNINKLFGGCNCKK